MTRTIGSSSGSSRAPLVLMAAAFAVAFLLFGSAASAATLSGKVESGAKPIKRAPVTLLKTTVGRVGPVAIGQARTDRRGRFSLNYGIPGRANAVLYLVSGVPGTDRRRAVRLASLLGTAPYPRRARLNERTTVAAAFAEAQFISGWRIHGAAPGPQNGALMAANMADPRTGRISTVLTSKPNGGHTPTRNTFNSLANMLAGCARDEARCDRLLKRTKVPGERRTHSTLKAFANVARNPANNVDRLFSLSRQGPRPYAPALKRGQKPNNWQLFLRFFGDGESLDGPGNFAFDAEGNAWVANNYEYSPPKKGEAPDPVCGGKAVMKFRPDGSYEPGSPYPGGGLGGVGYGITFDPDGNIWLGNFGFAAPVPQCPADEQPSHDNVSEFRPTGEPVDSDGYTEGKLSWPQGTVSNKAGDIWIANCGPFNDPSSEIRPHDSLTIYPEGDPGRAKSIRDPNLDKPFDIAFNRNGRAFVSSTQSDLVGMYRPDGTPTPKSPISGGGIENPMGVAADSRGNIWVSNSQIVNLPCPGTVVRPESTNASVTLISSRGEVLSPPRGFRGGGAKIAWGMAIDGNDNVWVANFGGQRVSSFCGMRERCPKGLELGDPISPQGGYKFSGLTRNTAAEIDPTGNVWIANNWKQFPYQSNPGGYEVVVMPGAAAPVRTPLIGQPKPLR